MTFNTGKVAPWDRLRHVSRVHNIATRL